MTNTVKTVLSNTQKKISLVLWNIAQNEVSFCLKQEQISVSVVIKIKLIQGKARYFFLTPLTNICKCFIVKKNDILMIFSENKT